MGQGVGKCRGRKSVIGICRDGLFKELSGSERVVSLKSGQPFGVETFGFGIGGEGGAYFARGGRRQRADAESVTQIVSASCDELGKVGRGSVFGDRRDGFSRAGVLDLQNDSEFGA